MKVIYPNINTKSPRMVGQDFEHCDEPVDLFFGLCGDSIVKEMNNSCSRGAAMYGTKANS